MSIRPSTVSVKGRDYVGAGVQLEPAIMPKALFCSVTLLLMVGFAAPPDPRIAKFWPLKPVVRPELPAAVSAGPNPIDAFISAKLGGKGLGAAGPADKRTLLRRVYLDLI